MDHLLGEIATFSSEGMLQRPLSGVDSRGASPSWSPCPRIHACDILGHSVSA